MSAALSAVPGAHLPAYEGQQVNEVKVKIAGLSAVDLPDDVVVSIDDRVRLVGEFRVTGVRHYVNDKGDLVREQVLKPIVLDLCPFDSSDPNDDGVIRAPRVGRP